ncbi:MAG: hypothetical protein ACYDHP_05725 [Ferrimicrobium sp.]
MTNKKRQRDGRSTPVKRLVAEFRLMPLLGRWAVGGAACLGVIGAVTGLVVGLIAHPPTAPFAALELGIPATIVGGAIGFVAGVIVMTGRRIRRRP